MKSMTKSELANKAGVSVKTLMEWCNPYKNELKHMGLNPRQKVLPPHIVEFISKKLCIDQ